MTVEEALQVVEARVEAARATLQDGQRVEILGRVVAIAASDEPTARAAAARRARPFILAMRSGGGIAPAALDALLDRVEVVG